jgi:hypothetical protein
LRGEESGRAAQGVALFATHKLRVRLASLFSRGTPQMQKAQCQR